MLLNRRTLLLSASLAAAPLPAWARNLARGAFTHGVASGDPTADSVILWTRFAPEGRDNRIAWELADDENFTQISKRGHAEAEASSDYCVKVDVRGLAAGRKYFYRFLSASGPSVTGRTLTAPSEGDTQLTIALFSCSNKPFGYFHAYADAAADESIDLAVHVGDYIYEYPRGDYPGDDDAVPGRVIEPANEIVALNDYNQRYASYHLDPDLLELRRLKPLCVVWDDHEITNDTTRTGAQNHQVATEGTWEDRVAAATKAYFDWMPIRRPERRGVRLYRQLDWGNLARIVLLDTRLIGRDRQLDYRNTIAPVVMSGGDIPAAIAAFRQQLDDPNRTLLGAEQESWFAQTLAQSKARGQAWQIVAQQIVMQDTAIPAGVSPFVDPNLPAMARQYVMMGQMASSVGLPINLDAWAGYPVARARFLQACAANAANAVVLGGDSHNCWVGNLRAPDDAARVAALEFAGGSVTSPGLERVLSAGQPGQAEAVVVAANRDMTYCDLAKRGYAKLRFTRQACDAEWRTVSDIRAAERGPVAATRFNAAAGASGPQAWTMA
ncbi:MAG: alkaline phosphatase D family protein [Hyphomonadaceae bacterium]|nr:alkaline phosphatase D family protein [Hyphomonadaceae bacterium]